MSTFNNNPELKEYAQSLRKNMTKEEKHLWYDFLKKLDIVTNRQKVIDTYIVDFCIPSAKLIIELDGAQHYEPDSKIYDRQRDEFLRSQGYTVLRYTNFDIKNNFDGVCFDILKNIERTSSTASGPPSPTGKANLYPTGKANLYPTGKAKTRKNMYDELTAVDIKKMEEEIYYRKVVLAPELGAELKRTRELGDLSENAEYKEAKYLKRKNESRSRYLEAMVRTAKVIEIDETPDAVALFDRVLIYNERMKAEKEIEIVTTLRQNALQGFVSKESPLGSAIMGKKVGDRVLVKVNDTTSYYVEIRKITKGKDNEDLPISGF